MSKDAGVMITIEYKLWCPGMKDAAEGLQVADTLRFEPGNRIAIGCGRKVTTHVVTATYAKKHRLPLFDTGPKPDACKVRKNHD